MEFIVCDMYVKDLLCGTVLINGDEWESTPNKQDFCIEDESIVPIGRIQVEAIGADVTHRLGSFYKEEY